MPNRTAVQVARKGSVVSALLVGGVDLFFGTLRAVLSYWFGLQERGASGDCWGAIQNSVRHVRKMPPPLHGPP